MGNLFDVLSCRSTGFAGNLLDVFIVRFDFPLQKYSEKCCLNGEIICTHFVSKLLQYQYLMTLSLIVSMLFIAFIALLMQTSWALNHFTTQSFESFKDPGHLCSGTSALVVDQILTPLDVMTKCVWFAYFLEGGFGSGVYNTII